MRGSATLGLWLRGIGARPALAGQMDLAFMNFVGGSIEALRQEVGDFQETQILVVKIRQTLPDSVAKKIRSQPLRREFTGLLADFLQHLLQHSGSAGVDGLLIIGHLKIRQCGENAGAFFIHLADRDQCHPFSDRPQPLNER